MRQFADVIAIRTHGRGLIDVTRSIVAWVESHDLRTGLLTLFCRHTSASLIIQENAAPEVRSDLEALLRTRRAGGLSSLRPRRRGPRRHARAHPRRADRRELVDPADQRAARARNLAGRLSVRASARAASARDRAASDRRVRGARILVQLRLTIHCPPYLNSGADFSSALAAFMLARQTLSPASSLIDARARIDRHIRRKRPDGGGRRNNRRRAKLTAAGTPCGGAAASRRRRPEIRR